MVSAVVAERAVYANLAGGALRRESGGKTAALHIGRGFATGD